METREQLDEKDKWRLEDIYVTDLEWKKDFDKVKGLIPGITKFQGKLNDPKTLMLVLNELSNTMALVDKLFVYASMKKDENISISKYQAM